MVYKEYAFRAWVTALIIVLPTFSLADNIYGKDNRTLMMQSDYPWSTIGKLAVGPFQCTGTLIGDDLVLTAAHCVLNDHTQEIFAQLPIYFYPNYIAGRSNHFAYAVAVTYPEYPNYRTGENTEKDWAVIRLNEPLGKIYGYMEIIEKTWIRFPQTVNLVGYSGDLEHGQTAGVHSNCAIQYVENEKYLHDCDMRAGASGGPLFMIEKDRSYIIGLNISEHRMNEEDYDENGQLPYSNQKSNHASMSNQFFEAVVNLKVGNEAPNVRTVYPPQGISEVLAAR